ncbi:MAG: efflux RND transporter permease subunit, partial [Deltaproteobacteria bacterium]|nr:efflux RND transporter permease subunit [Deltaproteobacteria bacterium]
ERVQVEIRGYDMDVADALAQKVKQTVESVKGITDAEISRKSGSPEELIIVDRPKAADMRLTVSSIARMLQTALGGSTASYFRQGGDEYEIAVRLENAENMGMDDILDLPLMNADGDTVMLRNVVDIRSHSGPVSIERKDQERIVTISANTGGRDLSSILRDIQKNIQSIPVPNGFTIGLAGEYEQQQETFSELAIVLLLALVLVYMVMVCLYESFRDPFVVMFSVPLAAIGVIWVLFLTGTTFNMQSFIGCIMLGGIVVNNAIILVDQINLLRQRDNMPLNEAIGEAGRRRLRPILMTTLTTIMGLVPMALGMGEGGEFQAPLGRAVIGGLFSAAMITLVVVPVVYAIFQHRLTVRKDISAGISS